MEKILDLTGKHEQFEEFIASTKENDEKLKKFLNKVDGQTFNFSIMHVGVVLDMIAKFFEYSAKRFEKKLFNANDRTKTNTLKYTLLMLNNKISLMYDLEEGTEIIESLVLYDNQLYLYFDKVKFLELINSKQQI